MFTKLRIFAHILIMFTNSVAFADLAIIAHPGYDTGTLDTQNVRKLFLGERNSFPSGQHATPLNHKVGSPDRKEFFSLVLSMPEASHKRDWKRKVARGAISPPSQLGSNDAVLNYVASDAGTIGSVEASNVDGTGKVWITTSHLTGAEVHK